jgi:methanogenic corrinoid protein MtbC1
MTTASHPIKVVAQRTGLSAHVIRIWEQRYGAVKPQRTGTNRRLYSPDEVARLLLLRELTQAGHNIGLIAQWPTETLRALAAEGATRNPPPGRAATEAASTTEMLIDDCATAMKSLDAHGFEAALKRGATQLGTLGLIQRVIAPLAQRVGDLWINGTITAAHEHLATDVIRTFLSRAAKSFSETKNAPVLLVATPAGQLHELGALLVAAMAANLGWQVTYLGVSLPAPEIAGAARQSRARAVALSLVYPEDDANLANELKLLRELLPAEVVLLAGGRAMPAYHETIQAIGAWPIGDLADLISKLDDLRKISPKKVAVFSN